MKKIIRDRSIFMVLASIIMAGVMLFCSMRLTATIHLPEELRAVLGAQADASFGTFFNELQDWYDSYEVGGETVVLTIDADYTPMADVFFSLESFLQACGNVTDEAEQEMLVTFTQPLMEFLTGYTMILAYIEIVSNFALTPEGWADLGESIDAMTALYQDYQTSFPQ